MEDIDIGGNDDMMQFDDLEKRSKDRRGESSGMGSDDEESLSIIDGHLEEQMRNSQLSG